MRIRQNGNDYGYRSDFDAVSFKLPEKNYWPVYSWIWNENVTEEGIREQIDRFAQSGIKGVYIIPEPREFRPESMDTHLDGYLKDEYMKYYRYAAEYALKKDMQLWLYDEGGWPSGSANGEVVQKDPSLGKGRYEEREKVLAARNAYEKPVEVLIAFNEDGKEVEEGYLPEKEEKIYEYVITFGHYTNMPYPDLLNPRTTGNFIAYTHERYREKMGDLFGEDFRVVFTDEPAIASSVYSPDLEERFEERYGYSYIPFLPAIVSRKDQGEAGRQARIDYCDLCGELLLQRYFVPIREWCGKNNMLSAGHIGGEDETLGCVTHGYMHAMRLLRGLDIPGIDTIWRQIFPKAKNGRANGTECANLFFPRYASSAAYQTSCNSVLSESYAIYGAGVTYDQMRYVLNFQGMRGVNLFNVMNLTYSLDHHFMAGARPTFDYRMPGASDKRVFHEYAARVSYLMSVGRPVREVALYMPMHDFWAFGNAEYVAEAFERTGLELERSQVSFDLFDDDVMESCCEEALDRGTVEIGHAGYRELWIPPCERMPEHTIEYIERFVRGGGKVYVIQDSMMPEIAGAEVISKVAEGAAGLITCRKTNRDLRAMIRKADRGTLLFVSNESFESSDYDFVFEDKRPAYELDCMNGKIYEAGRCEDGKMVFTGTLLSGESRIWLFTEEEMHCEMPRKQYTQAALSLKEFSFRKLRKFWLGKERPESIPVEEMPVRIGVGDWRSIAGDDFSGDALYSTEFCRPSDAEKIRIDLGEVKYSCELFLNGESKGIRCMAPYVYDVETQELKDRNLLEIRVSNTAANQYIHTDTFDQFPENVIGPYHNTTMRFEQESLESGLFGPVTIWK